MFGRLDNGASIEQKHGAHAPTEWNKEGDFSDHYNSGADLNRCVHYKRNKEEIFIGGYRNTDNIKIIYRSENNSKQLLEKCYDLEIPVEDDLIGGIKLYSNNKIHLTTFINAIASIASLPKQTADNIISLLPTTLSQEEYKSDAGDASKWFAKKDLGSTTYVNLKALKDDENIFVGQHESTDEIRIIYRNKKKTTALKEKCLELEIPIVETLTGGAILNSNNKTMLIAFLNAIDSVTPISEQVKNKIIASFPATLKQEEFKSEARSKWIKEGDFFRHYYSGASLNRCVTYKNLKALRNEEEIFIGGYHNTEEKQIAYHNKNKEVLDSIKSKCVEQGLSVKYNSYIDDHIRFYSSNNSQLATFIKVIDSERLLGKVVNDEMQQIFGVNPANIKIKNQQDRLNDLIRRIISAEVNNVRAGLSETPRHSNTSFTIFGRITLPDEKKSEHVPELRSKSVRKS